MGNDDFITEARYVLKARSELYAVHWCTSTARVLVPGTSTEIRPVRMHFGYDSEFGESMDPLRVSLREDVNAALHSVEPGRVARWKAFSASSRSQDRTTLPWFHRWAIFPRSNSSP